MDRRHFVAGSASLIVAASALSRNEHAEAHAVDLTQRPWSAAPEARSKDPRIRALAYAILAPNAFNLQPWLVELPGDDMLIVRCDQTLRLPAADADDRMTVITFGNFLELLRMAAAVDGYRLAVTPFPMGEPYPSLDGRPIASVKFNRAAAHADPLFAQVLERRTSKRPFEARPVGGSDLQALCALAGADVHIHASNDPHLVDQARVIAARAFKVEKTTPRINQEQIRVSRLGLEEIKASPDGIDIQGADIDEALKEGRLNRTLLADPASPASKKQLADYQRLCDTAQAYIWLCTHGNGRTEQLAAGRDWLRVHLKITELGLSFEPQSPSLNGYPEITELRQRMHDALATPPDHRVQMVGRLGYAAQMPPSAKWPAEAKVLRT